MTDVDISFFKRIYNEDIIYHYTKASTAIDFILYKEQLKFSKRRNSNDPIESAKARRGVFYSDSLADKTSTKEENQDANYLQTYISDLENQFYQICFCKNRLGEEFANENFIGHVEIFGFAKPRMWEQYADNYFGVCIAFSKRKMLELNSENHKLIERDVEYLTFEKLSYHKIDNIDANYLNDIGREKYKEQIKKMTENSFFYKHKDYDGENEYRIGTYFDKTKCCLEQIKDEYIFDRTMMLNIKGCIEAIFISSYLNDKQKKDLLGYANELGIPIIEMNWKPNSIEHLDYRNWVSFVSQFGEC